MSVLILGGSFMRTFGTALLILSLALPLAAAQGRRNGGGRNFSQMDSDHNGRISREEWKGRPEMFNRLDADNDGYITKDEMKQMRRNIGEGLRNMDIDKD